MVLLFFLLGHLSLNAQLSKSDPVYQEIMQLDSLLFQEAFNECNTDVLYQLIDEALEFYHDQSGITQGKDIFIEGIKKNICSLTYRPFRKLLDHSTEIYPLQSNGVLYGALQKGTHEFYAREKDKAPYLTSTAQFTHLWIKNDNGWRLKNVLSYDHKSSQRD